MEEIIIILVGFFLFLIIGLVIIRYALKEWKKGLYVCLETGEVYRPLWRCKMKNPSSGEWFEAIIYQGIEDERYYVMERKDFFNEFVKFVNLKRQWQKN